MTEKRVQFNNVVQNQLPSYVREDFPLISEFLKQYYLSQEFQGAPVDLIQNIDRYIKLDETTNLIESVILSGDISFASTTINIDLALSPTGTEGFPETYGLLKIGDEIITYTGKTRSSFTGCLRGFVGVSAYHQDNNPENLVFEQTKAQSHLKGETIQNLSCLFLKEFLKKTKRQILPLIDERDLDENLDQNLFLKQSKDFYLSRGTDRSYEILFKALYNENVSIIKPREFLFTPSNSDYRITRDLVVEQIDGDPFELENSTLFTGDYKFDLRINRAYAPVTKVEKVNTSKSDESYYKISLDAGYDRDVNVDGAIYGAFAKQPKTRLIGNVSAGASTLNVDSTVGFSTLGELFVTYDDTTTGVVSYTSKSITQFYGCSNIFGNLLDTTEVGINTFAYGTSNSDPTKTIKVRIDSVLSGLDYPSDTKYYAIGDNARIDTLGVARTDFRFKNWFYNVASSYSVESITLVDASDGSYEVTLHNPHYFKVNDIISIVDNSGISKSSFVYSVVGERKIRIKGQGSLSLTAKYIINRTILSGKSNYFDSAELYATNVQSVYDNGTDVLVASASIPTYSSVALNTTDRKVTFSGTFLGEELQITPLSNHGYYTGDAIYYESEKIIQSFVDDNDEISERTVDGTSLGPNFPDGIYYIKKIDDNTIKLSKTINDLYLGRFLSVETQVTVSNNTLKPFKFNQKTLRNQKLVRKIPKNPEHIGKLTETQPGFTGILNNGVEILNYKSKDVVKYGRIESVDITSSGNNYDIIDPPVLLISDPIGSGATGNVSVSGNLKEIRVIDPGFDYVEKPTIKISGGNGSGAVVSVNMKLVDYSAPFFSDIGSEKVGVGSTVSTIGFSTYHKFRNGEEVIYRTNGLSGVGGLSTDSSYYVSVQDNFTIKLYKKLSDVLSGINTVVLTSHGEGTHFLRSSKKKSVLDSVNVVSSGSGYENKKRIVNSSGVSTSYNYIAINNHGYNSGEIVKYTSEGTEIGGLTSGSEYYVLKVDDNNFKLTNVGLTTSNKDFYYKTNQYIPFSSVGVGTHIFNYPDISVSITGKIGISSIGSETFQAQIQPIFRGQITSVSLTDNGVGYGASDVLNLDKQPQISLVSGEDAQLLPIINNGRLVEVQVLSSGKKYNSPPDLQISGSGYGAVITPVLVNGSITSVKILETGTGYNQQNTVISVISPGSGASFYANIQQWRVNLFQKHFDKFTDDDGFIEQALNDKNELQYCHIYIPRKLRDIVYAVDQDGNILYGETDLRRGPSGETTSTNHSPIIGWAYDGHPIYGPYGYSTKSGGSVTQMKSGYVDESLTKQNRPPLSVWPSGFFVEDFTYKEVSDQTVLDENNGRYCVTPDYPNGTYAYFATIDISAPDSIYPFFGFKRPVFPYLIGNNFHAKPDQFNFDSASNQDLFDLNDTDYKRNTDPYNYFDLDAQTEYKYVSLPNNLTQKIEITSVFSGQVDSVGIITGGNNYRVNDRIIFDNTGTSGSNAAARVSRILGKSVDSVSLGTSSISNVEIYPSEVSGGFLLFADNSHDFRNKDIINITGLSTTTLDIKGSYFAGVSTNTFKLAGVGTTSSGIGSEGVTGIVTFFNLTGNLSFPDIRENDILQINDEKVKVLNVDKRLSRIRVLRSVSGTTSSEHSVGSALTVSQRKLTVEVGLNTTYDFKVNEQYYFNPSESVALGSSAGVGIGSTIFFSNPGSGATSIFIPTKTIFLKDHRLETGDQVTYSSNGGNGIIASDEHNVGIGSTLFDGQTLFVARVSENLIGLSTVKVGLGTTGSFIGLENPESTTLFFEQLGSGLYHSLKTNYSALTAELFKNTVTVSTAETHGIEVGHSVYLTVNPGITSSFTISYNDYNRKLVVNPKTYNVSGITTSTSIINIPNHGFTTGQKVIYTSDEPLNELDDNEIYYIVAVDRDNFKLAGSYYDSTRSIPPIKQISINPGTTEGGFISLINPKITLYKNSEVEFDVSDSTLAYQKQSATYSAFELNFYTDRSFTNKYFGDFDGKNLDVRRSGKTGIDADAKVTLVVNERTPEELYYRLDPLYDNDIPPKKYEINTDSEVDSNNQIIVTNSLYNGKHRVSIARSDSYDFTIANTPEQSFYSALGSASVINYETDCIHSLGPISRVEIQNGGKEYKSLPGITTITSVSGFGAILESSSKNIGRINKIRLKDIGYNFPADKTLRPSMLLPNILKIESLKYIDQIGITSAGKGYSSAPSLLLFDGKTNQRVTDVDLRYSLGDNKVQIFRNTSGISDTIPKIIPIQNSNGVGISTLNYNPNTNQVTITLSAGFSSEEDFPFEINDKVLIESTSVGVASTAKGFNSSDFNYKLFTLVAVDKNIGGVGATVAYNVDGLLNNGESFGTFDLRNSRGARIIPEKHFPIFDIKLTNNQFIKGETVRSNKTSGIVEGWDVKTGQLRVSTNKSFKVGERIEGISSKVQAIPTEVIEYDAIVDMDSSAIVQQGSQTNSGFLNANMQRIQDSFYYQNFSYSLGSRVPYETWNDVISTTNHPVGFKKFSNLQVETPAVFSDIADNSLIVGISTDLSSFEVLNNIYSIANLNCVYDFDLARENSLEGGTYSDEIIFSTRILTDYFESFGNRVVSMDDISGEFDNNARATRYTLIDGFNVSNSRVVKSFIYVKDQRYVAERQLSMVSVLHDSSYAYMNQFAFINSYGELGTFDFTISGADGSIQFYPVKYDFNDYQIVSVAYHLDDNLLGVGTSFNVGGLVDINTSSVDATGGRTNLVSIANTYRSMKLYVCLSDLTNNEFQYDELNIVHDDSEISYTEFGRLTTNIESAYVGTGFGTYYPYLDGSNLKVDFIPAVGAAVTANTMQIGISSDSVTGIGTSTMKHVWIEARSTDIPSSASPGIHTVGSYTDEYDAAYFIAQISDTTNNNYELREILLLDDYSEENGSGSSITQEFGIVETESNLLYVTGLGTFGSRVLSGGGAELTFTPNPNIDVQVKVYMNALRLVDDTKDEIDFENGLIQAHYATYEGTQNTLKRSFELTHKSLPIFERYFNGNDSEIVSIDGNTITIPNHFYVSGEAVRYDRNGGITSSIGIGTTTFAGIGSTEYLPINEDIFIIKVGDDVIQLASSAENALKAIPEPIEIVSVGIGTSHRFIATNPNSKCLIALDNLIQSPIVPTTINTTLDLPISTGDNIIEVSGITSFYGSDLIKLGDEIMKITGIGIGATNKLSVRRGWLGTRIGIGSTGDTLTKVVGNYNIRENVLTFVEAPYGLQPFGSISNPPDDRDWAGISTGSSFQGRMFMRSGTEGGTEETYSKNYLYDSLSSEFDGTKSTFTLTSVGSSDITGIYDENAIVLVNDIFQGPGEGFDYTLEESSGNTNIVFTGTASSTTTDVNTAKIPIGGVLLSVGSTEGLGYQPLVSAGGSAIVSGLGTISSISVGNTGYGYRASNSYEILTSVSSTVSAGSTEIYLENVNSVFDILNLANTGSNCQIGVGTAIYPVTIVSVASTFVRIGTGNTVRGEIPIGTRTRIKISDSPIGIVNVSVAESSTGIVTTTHVGFATILTGTGNISTSVTITNPGSGYTNTNSPYVVMDYPLSYSNVPLTYVGTAGSGLNATVDVVVSNGSSVTDFSINNAGVGYRPGEILTVQTGGLTGIPTSGTFRRFELEVQNVYADEFTAWSVGSLQPLDDISRNFDGTSKSFDLTLNGNVITVRSRRGSKIDVEQVLLVFINDILQEPGEGYSFPGGSVITFSEAPKSGDSAKIIFYKGSGDDQDVIFKEVIETVKKGDTLILGYHPDLNQKSYLQEDPRTVSSVYSTDVVRTFPYFGPGNTQDETLERPIIWCRQTEDKIIDENIVSKDRELYEPQIQPYAYIIKSVGIGSTNIYVDRVRPIFNGSNESSISLLHQNKVKFIPQEEKVGASATAIVSGLGTISSLVISSAGTGYTSSATVSIGGTLQQTVGFGSTATANATVAADGSISGFTITNPGSGYTSTNPPVVLISPPVYFEEENDVTDYKGDSGVIVGFGTTTVGAATTQFIFDLHIPYNSVLRNSRISGVAQTLSTINPNDYFIVTNSNIGSATTSIISLDPYDGSTSGVGTSYIDNVYVVQSVENVERTITGIGTTVFRRVFVNVNDSFSYGTPFSVSTSVSNLGIYSWGKIEMQFRRGLNEFTAYTQDGVGGISTSLRVERSIALRSKNYLT
jgi:hypothetical protein